MSRAVRRDRRQHRRARVALVGALVLATTAIAACDPPGTKPVPGTAMARPRTLYRPGEVPTLQARVEREPYRTVFVQMHQRADQYDDRTLGDHSVEAQRDLTRAAKVRAFE